MEPNALLCKVTRPSARPFQPSVYLSMRIGITIANLSVLKTNKARAIRFSTLEALCRELDCQPGELLEWTREESERA